MFDLGIQELVVIFVVALIVFGPKRLPELGRTLGKGILELRKAMEGIREQIHAEAESGAAKPLEGPGTSPPGSAESSSAEVKETEADTGTGGSEAGKPSAEEKEKDGTADGR